MWSGNVTLRDVKLRAAACFALGLPVHVKAGVIRSIQVRIPWSKIGSEPVVISLDGVYLVAGPLSESQWDEEAQSEWAWARKSNRLMRLSQAAEMSSMQATAAAAEESAGSSSSEPDGSNGHALSMLGKVLNNLQISLTNVHVRYEDRTQSTHPFAIGITLAELSYCTTDADGNRSFSIDASVQHKWLELKQLSVYHHCDCREMIESDMALPRLCDVLQGLIATSSDAQASGASPPALAGRSAQRSPSKAVSPAAILPPPSSGSVSSSGRLYVIAPMSMGARLTIRPELDALQASMPRISIDVRLSAVAVALCEQQLRDGARLVEYFSAATAPGADVDFGAVASLHAGRATKLARPSAAEDAVLRASASRGARGARARWQYARESVVQESRRQRGWRPDGP